MAMSYSYELQAKVYDAWQALKNNAEPVKTGNAVLNALIETQLQLDNVDNKVNTLVQDHKKLKDKVDGMKVEDSVPSNMGTCRTILDLHSEYRIPLNRLRELFAKHLTGKKYTIMTENGLGDITHYPISAGLNLITKLGDESTKVSRIYYTHSLLGSKFKLVKL